MHSFSISEAFTRLELALAEIKPIACLVHGGTTTYGTPSVEGFMFMGSRDNELCFKDKETRNYLYLRTGESPKEDTIRIPAEDAPFLRGIFQASAES